MRRMVMLTENEEKERLQCTKEPVSPCDHGWGLILFFILSETVDAGSKVGIGNPSVEKLNDVGELVPGSCFNWTLLLLILLEADSAPPLPLDLR